MQHFTSLCSGVSVGRNEARFITHEIRHETVSDIASFEVFKLSGRRKNKKW